MRARSRSVVLASAAALFALAPASASAGVTRTTIEPPSASLVSGGIDRIDVDVAPDGSGAILYRKKVGGVAHVFVARYVGGTWQPAEQADAGIADQTKDSLQPALAVGDGGRVVVVFPNGTTNVEDLWAVVTPSAGAPFGAPKKINPAPVTGWIGPNVKLAPNGDGYLTAYHGNGFWAMQVKGDAFTTVGATQLNQDPTHTALPFEMNGAAIGVDTTGATGTIAWSEATSGTGTAVWARKLTGTTAGPAVDATIPTFNGHPNDGGQNNDVDVSQSGGTAWVAQHVSFTYGASSRGRTLVSAFNGTSFGPAQKVDGIGDDDDNAEFAKVAVNAAGQGIATSYRGKSQTIGSEATLLSGGTWGTPGAVSAPNTAAVARSTPSIDTTGAGLVATYSIPKIGDPPQMLGRIYGGIDNGKVLTLSDPAFGDASAAYESGAGSGHAITAFMQGPTGTPRIVAAVVDLPVPVVPTPTPSVTPTPTPQPGAGVKGGPPSGTPAPVELTALKFRKHAFPRGKAAPSIVAAAAPARALSFSLTRASTVTLTVSRVTTGRTKGTSCVKSTKSNRKAKRCDLLVPQKGQALIQAPVGTTQLAFQGTLTAGKQLPTGNYKLFAFASDQLGTRSSTVSATFTLTAAKPPKKKTN